ncbi:MAG TPA: GAF domain-containing protein, partial [Acidimicrobiales bacterium]|nr:GAF domain-containing protein [Acidimicrobiales bacterium]
METTWRDGGPAADRSLSVLAGQKEILERLLAGEPLAAVLEALVGLIDDWSGDGTVGSILLVDRDGLHLRHGAAPGLPADYIEAIDGLAIGPRAGSCGTAAYRREQVVVEDIETDPLWEDFRPIAAAAGLRACWSTPIMAGDGGLLGTFAVYDRRPARPSPGDMELIELLVRTAAIAI